MGGLRLQKRLAARILKVGQSKIWIDPESIEDVKNAITRSDIKKLIGKKVIKVKRDKLKLPKPKKKRKKGPGSRKGAKGARLSKKEVWMSTIRPLRKMIKDLRDEEKITKTDYRKLYKLIKSGIFRSRSHLKLYLEQKEILKETEK